MKLASVELICLRTQPLCALRGIKLERGYRIPNSERSNGVRAVIDQPSAQQNHTVILSFRRPADLRDQLVRAKLPDIETAGNAVHACSPCFENPRCKICKLIAWQTFVQTSRGSSSVLLRPSR